MPPWSQSFRRLTAPVVAPTLPAETLLTLFRADRRHSDIGWRSGKHRLRFGRIASNSYKGMSTLVGLLPMSRPASADHAGLQICCLIPSLRICRATLVGSRVLGDDEFPLTILVGTSLYRQQSAAKQHLSGGILRCVMPALFSLLWCHAGSSRRARYSFNSIFHARACPKLSFSKAHILS
jgi:hypothetical protein